MMGDTEMIRLDFDSPLSNGLRTREGLIFGTTKCFPTI